MKNYRIDLAIIFVLVGTVLGIRIGRGNPPPIEFEPAKIKGDPDAPLYIVEFTDYQCPYCAKIQPTLKKILETFPNDVKLVYKHYPLDFIHSHSRRVAEAAECAGDQGKFWDYSDLLYEKTRQWAVTEDAKLVEPMLDQYAMAVGLNLETFHTCLDSGVKKDVIEKNKEEGKKLFVSGTPTLLLNGKKVVVSHDFEKLKAQIEKELGRKAGL